MLGIVNGDLVHNPKHFSISLIPCKKKLISIVNMFPCKTSLRFHCLTIDNGSHTTQLMFYLTIMKANILLGCGNMAPDTFLPMGWKNLGEPTTLMTVSLSDFFSWQKYLLRRWCHGTYPHTQSRGRPVVTTITTDVTQDMMQHNFPLVGVSNPLNCVVIFLCQLFLIAVKQIYY